MRIVNALNRLGDEVLNKYPEINRGGCCVFAAMVAKELQASDHHVTGIVGSWYADKPYINNNDFDVVREKVKGNTIPHWQKNGISFSHVGIEVKFNRGKRVYHYDTSGVHTEQDTLDGLPLYSGRLTVDELATFARYPKGWNDCFDRKDIPALRKLVKLRLKVD